MPMILNIIALWDFFCLTVFVDKGAINTTSVNPLNETLASGSTNSMSPSQVFRIELCISNVNTNVRLKFSYARGPNRKKTLGLGMPVSGNLLLLGDILHENPQSTLSTCTGVTRTGGGVGMTTSNTKVGFGGVGAQDP
ncbi:hypothetical protein IAQ61_010086, partial [Plenodomus lingam]|uniref:uncharacterized protein n=1 Tax=Leptosphaeria maculans TaxID=5022 RepID=UPI003317374D